jgi:altronate hydrolase
MSPWDPPVDDPRVPVPLDRVAVLLAPDDDVAIAIRDIDRGLVVTHAGSAIVAQRAIPRAHKLAVRAVTSGDPVRKYGQIIGRATRNIAPGDHVHTHNLGMDDRAGVAYQFGTARVDLPPPERRRTFQGYPRADGRAGTRQYVGIVTSVNCSASTARMIADQFRGPVLERFPHVDGVVAFAHGSGCGLVTESEGAQLLRRTLRGYASHPNIAGVLVLGLGCEMLPVESILDDPAIPGDTIVEHMTIQDTGGIRASVRAGVDRVMGMVERIELRRRVATPADRLVLGLNCGGSDGYSGLTANPALGVASDMLVAHGGTSVLAETPEVFGAEHLLTRRATEPVGRRLLGRIEWWRTYVAAGGGTFDDNPSPGNRAGGISTILEKSLGAVAKAGTASLSAVYEYAEPVDVRGLGFMDTPGFDPVSVTGLVAGGATVVCFTTGRGSVLGCKPSPSIKIATNSELFGHMREDMDLDAGTIAAGTETVREVGERIFETILEVASGRPTASESLDLGQDEFVPWLLGAVT